MLLVVTVEEISVDLSFRESYTAAACPTLKRRNTDFELKKNYSWCHQWNMTCSMLAVLPWAETVTAMAMTSRSVRQTVLLMVSLEQWMNVHDWYYAFYVSPLQAHQAVSSILHPQLHAQPTYSFLSLRRARRVLAPSLTHKRGSEGVTAFSTTRALHLTMCVPKGNFTSVSRGSKITDLCASSKVMLSHHFPKFHWFLSKKFLMRAIRLEN